MAWLRELMVRLGWSGGLDPLERDVDEEIRFHLEMRARAVQEAGMDESEAWQEAERCLAADAAIAGPLATDLAVLGDLPHAAALAAGLVPGTLDASTQFLDLSADFQSQAGAQSQCIAMRA